MSRWAFDRSAAAGDDRPTFYTLELFRADELVKLHFFDADELDAAKGTALVAVRNGSADRAEVRDDRSRLMFKR